MPAARRVVAAVDPPEPDPIEEVEEPTEEDSEGSSTASSAATDFFDDAGPEFDGKAPPVDEERAAFTIRPGDQELLDLEWDPKVIRSILETSGQALHSVAGKGDQDWLFIERELRAIAPPFARILSRYPTTAAAAAAGDEVAVIIGFSGYTLRSIRERKEAIAAANSEPLRAAPLTTAQPMTDIGDDPVEQVFL